MTLIGLVVFIIVVAILAAIVSLVLNLLPINPPAKNIIWVVFCLLLLLWLLGALTGYGPRVSLR